MKDAVTGDTGGRLLVTEEVARMVRLAPRTVQEATRRGEIACVRLGKRSVRYLLKDVLAWVEARRSSAPR